MTNEQHIKIEDWGLPILFDEDNLPPFPTEIFPDWLRNYIEAVAEETQTPKDASAMLALSILSTALAKKFKVNPIGNWIEPVNLYTVVVLPPANRKSAVFEMLKKPITEFELEERKRVKHEIIKNKVKRGALEKRKDHLEQRYIKTSDETLLNEIATIEENLEEDVRLTPPRIVVDDITQERLVGILKENNERIAILSAEGGIFEIIGGRYTNNGKANLDIYLKGHSGDYCAVDRMGREEILNQPIITMGLCVQPDVIKAFPKSFKGLGLSARILYSLPKPLLGNRTIRPKPVQDEIRTKYIDKITMLCKLSLRNTKILNYDYEADQILQAMQIQNEANLKPSGDLGEIPDWGGKLIGQIVRITGLLHLAEIIDTNEKIDENNIPLTIKRSTVTKCSKLVKYFSEHAKAAFGFMEIDPKVNDAMYLLKVILNKESSIIPYRDIQQLTKKRFSKADSLKTTLYLLEEREIIRLGKSNPNKKLFIQVNPYLLKNEKSTPIAPNMQDPL